MGRPSRAQVNSPNDTCRILSLDGGGAKGFYSLGVLKEVEAMCGRRLHEVFNVIYGTSTGAIIATLIALGHSIDEIHELYKLHVPTVMSCRSRSSRTNALRDLAVQVYADRTFGDMKTGVGVVTAKWMTERPMIFKSIIGQAHGSKGTFIPGFGVPVADAVQASCSAFPFFERKLVKTAAGDKIDLVDGGYCANNPTLYAIADAVVALQRDRSDLRVLSVGVGVYPQPKSWLLSIVKRIPFNSVELLQKTLEINTQSMDQLRAILFKDVKTVRISDTFERSEMATDLMEHDLDKLNILRQRGRESFGSREDQITQLLS
jgi:patatin-like phospholipase/acyl hydrolase